MRYTRSFERKIEEPDLATAAARAKRVCSHVEDCKLLAVYDAKLNKVADLSTP